ncbi:MAG: PilZ domain-containing protein [Synechococcus sp.]|nr:PilZ domain-containing protein [Synechococcus sp.]
MSESPRREERFLLPAVTIWIPATFRFKEQDHHGRLWDVSHSGCCLLFPPGVGVHPGVSGELMISHPSSNQSIPTSILILWVDREAGGTYAGCRFTRKIDFSRTFLNTLMTSNDHVRPPGGRLL